MTGVRKRDLPSEGFEQWARPIKARVTETMYRWQGKQVVHFLHVGKTGGTAIKHALRANRVTDRYLIKLHAHCTTLMEIPPGEKVVFFLRDPITRFVSGFLSRQRQGRPRFFFPWSVDEDKAFQTFATPNELALALSWEDNDGRKHAIEAMHSIQHVSSFYWDWFQDESYFLSRLSDVFFIGFQESLCADFTDLKSKLRLPDTVALPTSDVEAHRTPDSSKVELQGEAIRNLERWYAQDYDFLHLCREKAPWVNRHERLT
jgi:hypothetical protein